LKKVYTSIAVLLLLSGIGFTQGNYVPNANEEIYGTWINPKMQMQKNVSFVGGSKDYFLADGTEPFIESNAKLANKWTDAEGNVWYQRYGTIVTGAYKGTKWQSLEKISQSGLIREWVSKAVTTFAAENYPKTIDPKDHDYRIYYRAGG
jgi:hypothetical protein